MPPQEKIVRCSIPESDTSVCVCVWLSQLNVLTAVKQLCKFSLGSKKKKENPEANTHIQSRSSLTDSTVARPRCPEKTKIRRATQLQAERQR